MSSLRETAGEPKVDEPQPAVVQQENVRGVRVAVEEGVAEDHRHPRIRHPEREVTALVGGEQARIEISDVGADEPLEREHATRRVRVPDARYGDGGVVCEVPPDGLGVHGLLAIVELGADRARKLVDELVGVDEIEMPDPVTGELRRRAHEPQIRVDLPWRVGPLDLDDHVLPVRKCRSVHLPDRGGGHRSLLEGEKRPLDRQAELLLDDLGDLVEGHRGDIVLELPQLLDDVGGHQIGAGREKLAKLDKRRPELVEHLAEAAPAVGELRVTAALPALERVSEAVTRRYAADLREPRDAPLGVGTGGHG